MKKIIFVTGGTGGHIYPAISLAEKFREKNIKCIFIGSKYRMEKEIVPEHGFEFIGLGIKPFNKVSSMFRLLKSIFKSIKIIRFENPEVIIGFGNYISVPVLIAGLLLRKKVYIQEQNVKLGFANKIFFRFAKKIFLAFEESFNKFPIKYGNKLLITGNPLREEFYNVNIEAAREELKIKEDEKMVLILGGSLGAKNINDALFEHWDKFFNKKNLRVYWATGSQHFNLINEKIKKLKSNDVIKPYFKNIYKIMAASDIVMCRAGALTISELIELEKPAIIIPYDYVGQFENAEVLENAGAGKIYSNEELDLAIKHIFELADNEEEIENMKKSYKKLKKGNATNRILEEIDIWRN